MFSPDRSKPSMHQRRISTVKRMVPDRDAALHFRAHELNVYSDSARRNSRKASSRKLSSPQRALDIGASGSKPIHTKEGEER